MNKAILTAVPAALLVARIALAGGVGAVETADYGPYSLLNNYRFTEAQLRQFERVHVTAGTALWDVNTVTQTSATDRDTTPKVDLDQAIEKAEQSVKSESLFHWTDAHGKVWSVSVTDNAFSGSGLRISTPLVEGGAMVDDDAQALSEDFGVSVTAIPQPASLGMLAVGLACVCPRRRNPSGGEA